MASRSNKIQPDQKVLKSRQSRPKLQRRAPNQGGSIRANDPRVKEAVKSLRSLKGDPRCLAMARQIILPGHTSSPLVLPASTPATLCSRIIRKNFVIDSSSISPDGRTAILMTADLFGPAYILKPGASVIPDNPGPCSFQGKFSAATLNVQGSLTGVGTIVSSDGANKAVEPLTTATAGGVTHSCYDVTVGSVMDVTYNVRKDSQHSSALWLCMSAVHAGAWTPTQRSPQITSANVAVQGTFGMGPGDRYFAFWLEGDNGPIYNDATAKIDLSVTFGGQAGLAQFSLGGSSQTLFQKVGPYILDNDIESGRMDSMSMLVTNTSAALDKKGEIYITRATPDVLHDWANLEANITALPDNRKHIGAAEFGGYCWWMADTVETQNPAPIMEYAKSLNNQEIILCYIKGLDPLKSSFNVSFAWCVEFYTKNQLFEKVCTPPKMPEWDVMTQALSLVNAASCNPEHYDLFKSIITRGANAASAVYDHYKQHQAAYTALLGLLKALA